MGVFTTLPNDVLLGNGGTPSVSLGSIAGTGATYSILGNNKAGKVTLTTGVSVGGNGNLITLTLADGVVAPNGLLLYIQAYGSITMSSIVSNVYVQTTTSTASIVLSGVSLSVSTTYTFGYGIVAY